jgi:hypothetical protein
VGEGSSRATCFTSANPTGWHGGRDNLLGVDITLNEDFTFTVTKGNQVKFCFLPLYTL